MTQPSEINPSILDDIKAVATGAHEVGARINMDPLTVLSLVSLAKLAFTTPNTEERKA